MNHLKKLIVFIGFINSYNTAWSMTTIDTVSQALTDLQDNLEAVSLQMRRLKTEGLEALTTKIDELLTGANIGGGGIPGESTPAAKPPQVTELETARTALTTMITNLLPANESPNRCLYEVHEKPDNYIFPKICGKNINSFTETDITTFEYFHYGIEYGSQRNDLTTWVRLEQIYTDGMLDPILKTTSKGAIERIDVSAAFSLNLNKEWTKISTIIDELRWAINENSALKTLIIQKILPSFHCNYDIQPLNILFLQNGYREPSYLRLITASVLYYRGYGGSTDIDGPYKTLADVCLYELIKVIQTTTNFTILTAIETECNEYSEANAENKRDNVGFPIEGCNSKTVMLGITTAFSDTGIAAKELLLNAIRLRRTINTLEQEIAENESAEAQAKLAAERRAAKKAEETETTRWKGQAALEEAKRKEQLDNAVNASLDTADTAQGTRSQKWTAKYVTNMLLPWKDTGKTLTSNIFSECKQTELDFAKKLQTVCDKPEQIETNQLATVKEIMQSVIKKILNNQATVMQLANVGTNDDAKANFIHMMARIIAELPKEEIDKLTFYNGNTKLKVNGINLLEKYIHCYAGNKTEIDETTWSKIDANASTLNPSFVDKLKMLYGRPQAPATT